MSRRSAHTDTSYWETSPRGVEMCLNCPEKDQPCWYDRPNTGGKECPIWETTPKSDVRAHNRADEALKVIESICIAGPISTPELAAILVDRGYYRNIVYYLIEAGKLETERVKGSRHKVKIMVKGVKCSSGK